MSDRTDIKLILWSASGIDYMGRVAQHLESSGIKFDYLNENPEVGSDALIQTDRKMYFDIALDDKAFFNANHDWEDVLMFLGVPQFQ